MKFYRGSLILFAVLALFALTAAVAVSGGQKVCGGEHLSPPLKNLGAGEYCVKGGSSNSKGCDGYLATGSFDQVKAVVNASGSCGLSHWSFDGDEEETPQPTRTRKPSKTPDPTAPRSTATPDPEPSATPDPTSRPSKTPEASDTPRPSKTPKPDPSDTPKPKPTDTPKPKPPTNTPKPPPATFTQRPPATKPPATLTATPYYTDVPPTDVKCECVTPTAVKGGVEVWTYIHIEDAAREQLALAIASGVERGNEPLVKAVEQGGVSVFVETELRPILYALVAIFAVLGGNLILAIYKQIRQ